ncbi:MAG: DUF86 domain-containing protein [Anaerolineae bacterium]|nr:DUF86 domain-containing protein [Anaerolineae bacterium]
MSVQDDATRVRHMLDAARKVLTFTSGVDRQAFEQDEMRLLAVVRLIEILGEAASRVSAELRAAHPDIPWPAITGMRNRLIHAYFAVDIDRVWETVSLSIPSLISQLETIDTDLPTDFRDEG